ncbi:MAG: 30S ribosomal protein S9 [Oligosphaeraceae bacterium]|nr:30S ribosomal protein S9 [Oligosphaeraceae bacterium]
MPADKDLILTVGRRKCASARVRMFPGSGKIIVNKRAFEEYFTTEAVRGFVMQPLVLTGKSADFDIFANIDGGGIIGQAGALRHGIARALEKNDEALRATLKPAGMLTRDSREKERKKPGQPGARKRFQFSKR